MSVAIRRAGIGDGGVVGPLFERYCAFYERSAEPERAREFVESRMRDGDSVIFVAEVREGGEVCGAGFVQLYPKWSSTTMQRDWILNDLFVEPRFRRRGIGQALMGAAAEFCRGSGAGHVSLKTQVSNESAQRLYESLGWVRDEEFYSYGLGL